MEFEGDPIDLSFKPKNEDIDNKKFLTSPKPLPDLIPISMFIENTEYPSTSDNGKRIIKNTTLNAEYLNANEKSLFLTNKNQLKEKSLINKGLTRFRSVPQLSNRPRVLQQLKCRSESRIPFTTEQINITDKSAFMNNNCNETLLKPYNLIDKIISHAGNAGKNASEMTVLKNLQTMNVNKPKYLGNSSYKRGLNFPKSVPQDGWSRDNTLEMMGSYSDDDYCCSSPFYDSLKQKIEENKEFEERMCHGLSQEIQSPSNQYIKNGPGASLNTLHSLRKLLDRRKSVQKENVT